MSLTAEHVAVVKGLLARGEKQQDIAAFFGSNGGRIAEISVGYVVTKAGRKPHPFADVKPAPKSELPLPSQLVPWGFMAAEAHKAIDIAMLGLRSAKERLNEIEGKLQAAAEIERTSKRRKRQ
jgi:hypothetical protein